MAEHVKNAKLFMKETEFELGSKEGIEIDQRENQELSVIGQMRICLLIKIIKVKIEPLYCCDLV